MLSARRSFRSSPPLHSVATRSFSLPSVPELAQKHHLKVGDRIPSISFFVRKRDVNEFARSYHWEKIDSDQLFKGHRVVIFTVNGVFLPVCSKSTYVPNYEKYYDTIRSLGIHDVYCLSVNDYLCFRQWGLRLGLEEEGMNPTSPLNPGNFKKVKLLPDAELKFTRGMGMNTHLEGIGERSWRYSMVVDDGIIEKIFVEEAPGCTNKEQPLEVSNADTMLAYLRSVKK